MKRLNGFLAKILAVVILGVAFSGIGVSAFMNLSTTGSGTTAGGGSGTTPSLAQVTAVGAITSSTVAFQNVSATNATSTNESITTLNLPAQTLTGNLFVDPTGNASSSPKFLIDGNTGNFSTSGTATTTSMASTIFRVGSGGIVWQAAGVGPIGAEGLAAANVYTSNLFAYSGAALGTYPFAAIDGSSGNALMITDSVTGATMKQLRASAISLSPFRASSTVFMVSSAGNISVSGTALFAGTSTHSAPIIVNGSGSSTFLGGVSSTQFFAGDSGSVASPGYSFYASPSMGFWGNSAGNQIEFITAGVSRLNLDSSGASFVVPVLPASNGTLALGTAGLRFSTLFVGNVSSSGSEIVFGGLSGNPVTDDTVCYSATGTLRHETTNCTVSSARFKDNIAAIPVPKLLEETLKLRAVSFDWKEGYAPDHGTNAGGKESTGLIAEEVAMIDPQLVAYEVTTDEKDIAWEEKNYPGVLIHKDGKTFIPKTVDYARVSYLTVAAIQAQQTEILDLQNHVGLLDRILKAIKSFLHLK